MSNKSSSELSESEEEKDKPKDSSKSPSRRKHKKLKHSKKKSRKKSRKRKKHRNRSRSRSKERHKDERTRASSTEEKDCENVNPDSRPLVNKLSSQEVSTNLFEKQEIGNYAASNHDAVESGKLVNQEEARVASTNEDGLQSDIPAIQEDTGYPPSYRKWLQNDELTNQDGASYASSNNAEFINAKPGIAGPSRDELTRKCNIVENRLDEDFKETDDDSSQIYDPGLYIANVKEENNSENECVKGAAKRSKTESPREVKRPNSGEKSVSRDRSNSKEKKSNSKVRSKDRRTRSKDRRSRSKDRRSRSKDRRSRSKDRRSRSKDRRLRSKGRRSRSKDRRSRSKDRRSRSKDRRSRSKDRRARSKDRRLRSNDRRSRSKDRRSRQNKTQSRSRKSRSKDRRSTSKERKLNGKSSNSRKRSASKSRSNEPSEKRKRSKGRSYSPERSKSREGPTKESKEQEDKRSISKERSKRSRDQDGSKDRTSRRSREKSHSRQKSSRRSTSKERKRSKSKERKRSKSKERKRSKSRELRRSKSFERHKYVPQYQNKSRYRRSRSNDRCRRSRSKSAGRRYPLHSPERSWQSSSRNRGHRSRSRNRYRSRSRSPRKSDYSNDRKRSHSGDPVAASYPVNLTVALGVPTTSVTTTTAGTAKSSRSIADFTAMCKKLTEAKENENGVGENTVVDEKTSHVYHPFNVKPAKEIVIPPVILPVLKPTGPVRPLEEAFPVSRGNQHKTKENTNESMVEGVDGSVANAERVFQAAVQTEKLDVSGLIAKRMEAQNRLQSNPHDFEAGLMLQEVQMKIQNWASVNLKPGQFTGESLVNSMIPKENINSGYQAWARKDMFHNLAPIRGGVGMKLLQKMGWRPGQAIGKRGDGGYEPIALTVKTDRKGLVSFGEPGSKGKGGGKGGGKNILAAQAVQGKHPVSALAEICTKRRWKTPAYNVAHESGPSHKKDFLFQVVVNGISYQHNVSSNNKKLAKAEAAFAALKALDVVPADAAMTI